MIVVYWTHARIFLLAGVLFQGVTAGRAKPHSFLELKDLKHVPSPLALASINHQKTTGKFSDIDSKRKYSALRENSFKVASSLSLPVDRSLVEGKQLRALTIDEVERLVELNNPTLKAAAIQIEQERSKLLAAISAWYPSVDLSANGLPQYLMADSFNNPDYSATPNTRSSQWKTQFSANVKWKFVDPARVPQIAAARDGFERARDSYLIALRDIRLQALIKFFELQRADQGVLISNKALNASLLSQKDADARFDAGLASKFETLEAKTQLARDRRLLNNSLRDQKIARRSLAEVINLPQHITPISSSLLSPVGLWSISLGESIIAAYMFREELDRYLLDISINNNKANESLAAIDPIFSLVNTFSTSRTQGQLNVVEPSNKDYSWTTSNTIGVTATWKIFDGGSARALYRLNKQRAKEKEMNFLAERNKIKKEVEESYFNLTTASKSLVSTREEIKAQREVLRLARLRFNAGVSNQREILDNQRDLRQAEVNYADAIATYNTNLAQLRRRTGLDEIRECRDANNSLLDVKESDENPQNSGMISLELLCQKPLIEETE